MAITAAPDDYAGLFHALRATGTARPVPRGRPPLASPPGTAPNPWLLWFLGGGLLGVLLSLREPWIERLGHALSLGLLGTVLGDGAGHAAPSRRLSSTARLGRRLPSARDTRLLHTGAFSGRVPHDVCLAPPCSGSAV